MSIDSKEDELIALSQLGAFLVHHTSTPIAVARMNSQFISQSLPELIRNYRETVADGPTKLSSERLEKLLQCSSIIDGELSTIQQRISDHFDAFRKIVDRDRIASFQLARSSERATIEKVLNQKDNVSILLVEDEEIHQRLATLVLRPFYQVDVVNSGEDAVQACNKKDYDLILMDLHLPGLGGLEAGARIRKTGAAATIIIGLTNMPFGAVDQDDPMNAYLSKPFEMQSFQDCLRAMAERASGIG